MGIMGIDLGTTTVSVVMLDGKSGAILGSRTVAHHGFLNGHIPEAKIQDPQRMVDVVRAAAAELEKEFGAPECIGLTGQMHGMLYVDTQGEAVSPLYIWQDGCGNLIMENDETYASYLRKTGGAASAGFGLTTHFYLQKNGMIPKNAAKMVTICDYVGMKLCESSKTVIAKDMAASWGCFDLRECRFLVEEMETLGVDTSYLPELMDTHGIMGHTPEGIPVIVSLGDNQASVLGSVSDLCDTVLINIGTGSQVSVGTENYHDVSGSIELRPCVEGTSLLVGSGLCGGRAYAMLEQFYREAAGSEEAMYDRMAAQAEEFREKYGSDAAWKVRTTFSGTRSNPNEKGSITGIGVENFHPGAMTLGIIAGILEELHEMYVEMCRVTGRKATRLVGSGNGIRKNRLMQTMAEEIFGMPLAIPQYQEEAAYGAALYALAATGKDSFGNIQKKIRYCTAR